MEVEGDPPTCVNTDDEIRLGWPKKFTPATTTQAQRDRAVSIVDAKHARRLLLKLGPLLLGEREKLVVGTIGGSVTTGLKSEHGDYPTQFADGLRDALTAMDSSKGWVIESRNGAQGGTGSGYFALCVNRHIAHDTDIALVELNVNDGTDRAYERVHRKILARENNIAVLEVLIENWKEKDEHGGEGAEAKKGSQISVVPDQRWKKRLPLLDHYDVPYVTQAEALGPEVERDSKTAAHSSGPYDVVEWLDEADVRDIREHYFISLGKHMLNKGHRMMAELLMEAILVLVKKHGGGCKSTLRAAMIEGKMAEENEVKMGGIGAKDSFHPNIVERHTESCVTPKQILRISRASEGWELKDERSPRGEHKFGVVATQPGSWLNMSLDTRPTITGTGRKRGAGSGGGGGGGGGLDGDHTRNVNQPAVDDTHAMVTIAYLASYEHMGRVEGSCGGGCTCDPFTIDALWERRSSELQLHHVRTEPPAEHCHVNLRLDEGTKDQHQEHKFKVLQVTVQEDFVEGKSVGGHEEGGIFNNFKEGTFPNYGEQFDGDY